MGRDFYPNATDLRAMGDQSKSKVVCEQDDCEDRLIFTFRRTTPFGEVAARSAHSCHELCRYGGDVRDFYVQVARTAGRRMDAEEKKKRDLAMSEMEVLDPIVTHAIDPDLPWKDAGKESYIYERTTTSPHHWLDEPATLSGRSKKKAVTDELIAKLKTEKEKSDTMEGMTASERFDLIRQTLSALNENLMGGLIGEAFVAEIWAQVQDNAFRETPLVEGEAFAFDRIIYSERLDKVVVAMNPKDGTTTLLIDTATLDDAFPELVLMTQNELGEMESPFKTLKELEAEIKKLSGGKGGLKKALAEASYGAVVEATAKKEEKKQAEAEDFYASNPLYGMF
jgi:hypothetical protein